MQFVLFFILFFWNHWWIPWMRIFNPAILPFSSYFSSLSLSSYLLKRTPVIIWFTYDKMRLCENAKRSNVEASKNTCCFEWPTWRGRNEFGFGEHHCKHFSYLIAWVMKPWQTINLFKVPIKAHLEAWISVKYLKKRSTWFSAITHVTGAKFR